MFRPDDTGSGNEAMMRYGMTVLMGLFVAVPAMAQSPYQPPADFTVKATELLNAMVTHRDFSGSVMVAHHGKPLIAAGYGLANRDHGIPNTVSTRFRIGSVTKQFTAACILKLQDAGKLKLSDPLIRHLSDCPKAWADVTILQLLSHTGGIPEHTTPPIMLENLPRNMPPEKTIGLIKDKPLDFKPGEKWKYSNTGYVLLGMVIEKVSEQRYGKFLQEQILKPAGMTETSVEITGQVLPNRATGYSNAEQQALFTNMTFPFSAGAMVSTVGDLVKWDRALAGDTLLTPESKKLFFTEVKDGYALGVGVGKRMDRLSHAHGGGIPGFVSQFVRFPDDGLAFVVLTNRDNGRASVAAGSLAAIAFGKPYVVPEATTLFKLTTEQLDRYTGTFTAGKSKLVIERTETRLTIKQDDRPTATYTPISESRFSSVTPQDESLATFTMAEGKATQIRLRGIGRETTFERGK